MDIQLKQELDDMVTASLIAIKGMTICEKHLANPSLNSEDKQFAMQMRGNFRIELDEISYMFQSTLPL